MIGRIRDRRAFERLAREGRRIRRSDLWCTWCPDNDAVTTSVAFAIGRALGPATRRNRLRRRLRSALREIDADTALPPVLLLLGARPGLTERSFDQLRSDLQALIAQLRVECRG